MVPRFVAPEVPHQVIEAATLRRAAPVDIRGDAPTGAGEDQVRQLQAVETCHLRWPYPGSLSGRIEQPEVVAEAVVSDQRAPIDEPVEGGQSLGRLRRGNEVGVTQAG